MSALIIRNTYGEHMLQRLEMEKAICSSFGRLPVLRSEMPSLQSITKADLQMDFDAGFGTFYFFLTINFFAYFISRQIRI